MHIHSRNSHDAKSSVSEIARICIEKGISRFAVTDHCDVEYFVRDNVPGVIKNSVEETENTAKDFVGKVEILRGIEIGEGIWNAAHTAEILASHRYDVVISSVHAVRYKNYSDPYAQLDFSALSEQELDGFINKYFDELYEMLHTVPCDIMAHLTCPFRYINGKYALGKNTYDYREKILPILEYAIKSSVAMEINTSGIYSALGDFMPDEWVLKDFLKMGGHLITLGSDAHIAQNAGGGLHEAIELLKKHGVNKYYYYKERKPVECRI